jgi:hypothetical protein
LVGWLDGWLVGWMVGWLVYSCCSHLEHRASVKRFVSLQFLNLRHSVGLLGQVISPSQGRYLTQTQKKHRHPCLDWGSNPRSQCSERAKTVHALDGAATVIGTNPFGVLNMRPTYIYVMNFLQRQ